MISGGLMGGDRFVSGRAVTKMQMYVKSFVTAKKKEKSDWVWLFRSGGVGKWRSGDSGFVDIINGNTNNTFVSTPPLLHFSTTK